jgi:hypothetical protein
VRIFQDRVGLLCELFEGGWKRNSGVGKGAGLMWDLGGFRDREFPSWTNALGMAALGFLSASLGLQVGYSSVLEEGELADERV